MEDLRRPVIGRPSVKAPDADITWTAMAEHGSCGSSLWKRAISSCLIKNIAHTLVLIWEGPC